MSRIARIIASFIVACVLFWLSAMFTIICVYLAFPLIKSHNVLAFLVVFILGTVLFHRWKFTRFYVFGHELTHFIVAKIFLKDTGKLKISKFGGYVEVKDSNIWITLAPYVIPFYTFIAMGIFGLIQIFVYPMPSWMVFSFSCVLGISYAYHWVLTIYAISHSQSDLRVNGRFLSLSIIAAGNTLLILTMHLLVSSQWKQAFALFCTLCKNQINFIYNLL